MNSSIVQLMILWWKFKRRAEMESICNIKHYPLKSLGSVRFFFYFLGEK